MAGSFSRENLREASQKEGGEILYDLPPLSCVTPAGTSTKMTSRINGMTILSTCPLHSNSSGCGKREVHINWSMVTCKMAAVPVTGTTLRTTGPVPVDSRQ